MPIRAVKGNNEKANKRTGYRGLHHIDGPDFDNWTGFPYEGNLRNWKDAKMNKIDKYAHIGFLVLWWTAVAILILT